jgi:hypothetical protein
VVTWARSAPRLPPSTVVTRDIARVASREQRFVVGW